MVSGEKKIYVFDDFSFDEPQLMGTLYVSVIRRGESYAFEYNSQWGRQTEPQRQMEVVIWILLHLLSRTELTRREI